MTMREYYLVDKFNLKKDKNMIVHVFVLIAVLVVGVTGIYYSGKPDDKVEELAEEIMESEMEKIFHLRNGELDGKIDLTPSTPED